MTQQEILNFLKKNKGKWFTSKEIAKKIKKNRGSVQANLKRLRKSYPFSFTKVYFNTYKYMIEKGKLFK